jgi:FkbM family methyltransferase
VRHSQQDEDVFVSGFFWRHPPKNRTFCDVGAFDGVEFSNTRILSESGWTGVLVEPDPSAFGDLKKNCSGLNHLLLNVAVGDTTKRRDGVRLMIPAKDHMFATCLPEERQRLDFKKWSEVPVPLMSLREVLNRFGRPVDFLSVDAEGMDVEVLESAGFSLRDDLPSLVMLEHNRGEDVLRLAGNLLRPLGYTLMYKNVINVAF